MKNTIRCETCGRVRKKQHEKIATCGARARRVRVGVSIMTRAIYRSLWKMVPVGRNEVFSFKEFMKLENM